MFALPIQPSWVRFLWQLNPKNTTFFWEPATLSFFGARSQIKNIKIIFVQRTHNIGGPYAYQKYFLQRLLPPWWIFIYWANATSLTCKENVQSTNTFEFMLRIQIKRDNYGESGVTSPCWHWVSILRPSDPVLCSRTWFGHFHGSTHLAHWFLPYTCWQLILHLPEWGSINCNWHY